MYKKGSLGKEAGGDEKFGRGLNKLGETSERNEVSLIFKAYVFLDFGTFRTEVQIVDTTFTSSFNYNSVANNHFPIFLFHSTIRPPNAQSTIDGIFYPDHV